MRTDWIVQLIMPDTRAEDKNMAKRKEATKNLNAFSMIPSNEVNVFSPMEFKALIRYERIRADRNSSDFSVAAFKPTFHKQESLKKMINHISRFTRAIDCIGWNEQGQIVVLLPETKKQGAETFGRKMLAELDKIHENSVACDIYSYPEHWLTGGINQEASNLTGSSGNSIKNNIEFLFVNKIPVWKRILDISGAMVLLVLTAPILLFSGIFIKLVSPGPVFFKQIRIGYKGIPFTFWKLRTMKFDNNQSFHGKHAKSFIVDGDVPMEKLDNLDPRIIIGGKVLRKSCIDELPQLWNIIIGDMSLVGPRPCIPYEAQEYLRWHTHRFDTLPGLSGLWQVSGKNKLTFKQMIRLDITYCKNINLWGDILIIIRTPLAIMQMIFDAVLVKFNHQVDAFRTGSEAGEPSVNVPTLGSINKVS